LFSLPSDDEGASWCTFVTEAKFSESGTTKLIPSAGIVGNSFFKKQYIGKEYDFVAGPNKGGVFYTNMVGPGYNYDRYDRDYLEPMGVNVLVYSPTRGTYINSNVTAKQNPQSSLSYVHVRELVIYLQDEITEMLRDHHFDYNVPAVRDMIKGKADSICDKVYSNNGLVTYYNVMDESNNTQDVINAEMAVLDTHIEPAFGCGKIVHRINIYKTGQLSGVTTAE